MTNSFFDTHSLTIELPIDIAEQLAKSHVDGLEGAAIAALKLWIGVGSECLNMAGEYAKRHNLTRAQAIQGAIHNRCDEPEEWEARVRSAKPIADMRAERDADLYRRHKLGIKRTVLADDYKLSLIRVHQIIAAEKAKEAKQRKKTAPVTPLFEEPDFDEMA